MRHTKSRSKIFYLFLVALFVFGLIFRLYVLRGDNLFFTVDQGRDAVYIREILTHRKLFVKGPETNIRGIYTGPGIYYFFALGYLFSGGHPVGAVLSLIFLNLALSVFLAIWLRDKVGGMKALLVVAALQIFWPFFTTSLWGFNPFLLVAISFALLILLTKFIQGNPRFYYLGLVPIFLAYNAEVAGATALFIFYILVGVYGIKKKIIKINKGLVVGTIAVLILGLILAKEFVFKAASGVVVSQGANAGRVFVGTAFRAVASEFINIIGTISLPHNAVLGFAIFVLVTLFYLRMRKGGEADVFIILSLALTALSYVFFSSNLGYRGWHTVYLPPLLFVSFLLMLFRLPRRIGLVLFLAVMAVQIPYFYSQYKSNVAPSDNPSLLYNQERVLDWIYGESKDLGFKVYNYTDTFYDYPYQYLFWWYGREKYGYLPDEYANYPLSPKELYVPGYGHYMNPARSGEGLRFLIIQSDTNGESNADWLIKFREFHSLEDSVQIGGIRVEKYRRNHDAPNDPCIWWDVCNP